MTTLSSHAFDLRNACLTHFNNGDYRQTIAHAVKATALDPAKGPVYALLATALSHQQAPSATISQLFDLSLELAPQRDLAHRLYLRYARTQSPGSRDIPTVLTRLRALTPDAQDIERQLADHWYETDDDRLVLALTARQATKKSLARLGARSHLHKKLRICEAVGKELASRQPQVTGHHRNHAIALYGQGLLNLALAPALKAAALDPVSRKSTELLLQILSRLDRKATTEQLLKIFATKYPEDPKILLELSKFYRKNNQMTRAGRVLRKLANEWPDSAEAYAESAEIMSSLAKERESMILAERAYRLSSDDDDAAAIRLVGHCKKNGHWDRALELTADLIERKPNSIVNRTLHAQALRGNKDLEGGDLEMARAVALDPSNPQIYIKFLEERPFDPVSAGHVIGSLQRHINQHPIYTFIGRFLRANQQYELSQWFLPKAIRLRPNSNYARSVMAYACLQDGDFGRGFDLYESGFFQEHRGRGQLRRTPPPYWTGEPIAGKSIYLYREQGIGDEIQFLSVLPDLVKLGAKVIYETGRLTSLLRRSLPEVRTVSTHDVSKPRMERLRRQSDYQLPIGSLARILRRSRSAFHTSRPFLIPDPRLVRMLRKKYRQAGKPVCGISWKGGSGHSRIERKSTTLDEWFDAFRDLDYTFVSLQYGDVEQEISDANRNSPRKVYYDPEVDQIASLDIAAAQVAACDVVFSTQNATVHLAGALGVPCVTMPPTDFDWRWQRDEPTTVWYPAMRLVFQGRGEPWTETIKRAASTVKGFTDAR